MRQGTETFYLKIAKEMGDQFSILTPLYQGTPHWSKPPIVFWFSLPFYWILPIDHHTAARFSMVIIAVLTTFLLAKEISRNTKSNPLILFVYLISSFGFFRYGKIFMLDIPLATLTSLSILYFYNSLIHKNSKLYILSIITLCFSILVKGPVSLAMIAGSLGLYGLLDKENRQIDFIKKGILYFLFGSLLASIWFVASYLKHGQEFFDYFFLRENLGKFQSQSYPIKKLFQGLLLYGLPWSFVLFSTFKYFKNWKNHFVEKIMKDRFYSFLFCCFICFFFIWFIPNQRSHHYAIPALPFFLTLLYPLISSNFVKVISGLNIILASIFGSLGLFLGFRFIENFGSHVIFISLALLFANIIIFKYRQDLKKQALSFLLTLTLIWSLLIPQFSLPKLPSLAVDLINSQPVFTVFKKNYYYEQVLNRKISGIAMNNVINHALQNKAVYIFTENFHNKINKASLFKVLYKWPVWKRRVKWPLIKSAIAEKDLSLLQENYLLLKSSSMD